MYKLTKEDKDFLSTYKASDYERPSVTVDILIFTIQDNKLKLMLIKRKKPPFRNKWAIPGGFLNMDETTHQAALRELKEETNIKGGYLEQFDVFSEVKRDPRTRVISIGYIALLPYNQLIENMKAGDDAKEIDLFDISLVKENCPIWSKLKPSLFLHNDINNPYDLAFDHGEIIRKGIYYLQQKLLYGNDSFVFFHLLDKNGFTIFDLQKVHEAILNKSLDRGNFRKNFIDKCVKTGRVIKTNEKSTKYQRPATLYKINDYI